MYVCSMQLTYLPLMLIVTRVHADTTSSYQHNMMTGLQPFPHQGAQPVDSWKTKVVISLGGDGSKPCTPVEHQNSWQMDSIYNYVYMIQTWKTLQQ